MTLTIPDPSNIKVQYNTRAEFQAASIPSTINYVLADGLTYKRDTSGTALTAADGSKWSPTPDLITPVHFGAVGDGTTDDTASIQACFDYAVSNSSHNLTVGPKGVVSGLGLQYAISSGLTISGGSDGMVFRDFSLLAIGGGWNSATDYMVTNSATYSDFYSFGLNCAHLCRGWNDAAGSGRARHWSQQIYQMAEVGYHKSGGGGELRYIGGQITQYLAGDNAVDTLAEQGNYDAIGMLIEESDCKIHDTNIRWCGTCYESTGGQQYIYNCHFVQGTNGLYGRTNARLIKWDPASGSGNGELFVSNTYLDNGYCDLYDDKVNFMDCTVLLDVNDVDVDNMFRFYAYSGATECRATARIRFSQWDDTANLFNWLSPDGGTTTWPDDYSNVVARILSILSGGVHQEKVIDLYNTVEAVSTNTNGNATVFNSTNIRSLVGFRDRNTTGTVRHGSQGNNAYISASEGLMVRTTHIEMDEQSVEPAGAGNYSLAMSDGTSSTNGFGTTGAGLYIKLSGSWTKL